ncbi:MAG: hypothetical protein OEM91_07125 [Hyphomicrobiales bacterium]|nr:hypothetical protein [Hyphomicrobiales bacterium]
MTRILIAVSFLMMAMTTGNVSPAQAHSAKACERQIKLYQKGCRFSPTALLLGACIVKETLKACKDPKKHKKAFHEN